jgi:hypothetical protein
VIGNRVIADLDKEPPVPPVGTAWAGDAAARKNTNHIGQVGILSGNSKEIARQHVYQPLH